MKLMESTNKNHWRGNNSTGVNYQLKKDSKPGLLWCDFEGGGSLLH